MSTILIMHFYAQVMNISVELFNKKWRGRKNILCNKPKTEVFLENRGHAFSDIEISKLPYNFIWLRAVGDPKSFAGFAKLDTIWDQFAWQIFNRFLWNVQ